VKATVAERGQVTIPKSLRERLGIKPGTVLEFSEKGGKLVAEKVVKDPIERVRGILGHGLDTDTMIEEMRGPAE
jgi:AbrB family looped-hinge helix DNA binding protein